MNAIDIVDMIVPRHLRSPKSNVGVGQAPVNIALIKYWGKRNHSLNLPYTDSLSVSLPLYTTTEISEYVENIVYLNDMLVNPESGFYKRIQSYLDLFRIEGQTFCVRTTSSVPISAGLASSASGYAALMKSILDLYKIDLDVKCQSILARLGSGSAARSVVEGFVHWHRGSSFDGLDSYAEQLDVSWSELCIGININDRGTKYISSRAAMKDIESRSRLYKYWPTVVSNDISDIYKSLHTKNFETFGRILEDSSILMHSLMHSSNPSVNYTSVATLEMKNIVRGLRREIPIYFTQDAGSNLKLFFLSHDADYVQDCIPNLHVMQLFT